ncbi:reverse transcriptase domain-containing protein [Odoribacter lunatus]|uniref:reverse transcriptase domain-containing protein n=1 Tax=Odoribacter lunatus TaxID=2941335 RepID=UPI00203EE913|nr:reverse transcriptase domain-containing protein [Odoribacter lunatus]
MVKERDHRLVADLFRAYFDARKNKRNTLNQLAFELELEKNLFRLYDEIVNRCYVPKRSAAFVVERPVKREIFCADFRDRVIHHLLFNYLNPVLDGRFINDSYSCREGKGVHYGQQRVARAMRACSDNFTREAWILKLDIQGYFMEMDRGLLYEKLRRHMEKPSPHWGDTDMKLVDYLVRQIVFNNPVTGCLIRGTMKDWEGLPPSKSLFHSPKGCGLPIGNLTSQLFSNVYLHDFDTWMKYNRKLEFYGRYVDDFYVVHRDKEFLLNLREEVREYLRREEKLTLHPRKFYLQRVEKGVLYLGIVIKPYYRLPASRTKANFYETVRKWNRRSSDGKELSRQEREKFRAQMNSYFGYLKHYDTMNLQRNVKYNLMNYHLLDLWEEMRSETRLKATKTERP